MPSTCRFRRPRAQSQDMSKVFSDPVAALDGLLHDDMTIAAGGFGLCGIVPGHFF